MRIINLLRKKTQHKHTVDESNLLSIEVDKTILLNNKTWKIKKIIEYTWGEGIFSYDYIIDDGKSIAYLGIEKNKDNLVLSIKSDVNIDLIDSTLKIHIQKNEVPPRTINYNGIQFYFDRESVGKSKIENAIDWTVLTVWEFIDNKNKNVLTIEQYSDKEIFCSIGCIISISEI